MGGDVAGRARPARRPRPRSSRRRRGQLLEPAPVAGVLVHERVEVHGASSLERGQHYQHRMSGLVSGEGVAIELSRAGLGSRTVAAAIDLAVQFAALLAAWSSSPRLIGAGDSAAQAAVALVEVVLVLAGYPIVFEWLSRGRTLGKMAMGLRVVRDDGGPIGFRQALVRGLAGFLLEKPGIALGGLGTAIGMITIGVEPVEQAGRRHDGRHVRAQRTGRRRRPRCSRCNWWVPPALYGWAQSLDLSGFDDQLALQLRQFVLRAPADVAGRPGRAGRAVPGSGAWRSSRRRRRRECRRRCC